MPWRRRAASTPGSDRAVPPPAAGVGDQADGRAFRPCAGEVTSRPRCDREDDSTSRREPRRRRTWVRASVALRRGVSTRRRAARGPGSAATASARVVTPVRTSAESRPARRAPATSTSSRSPTASVLPSPRRSRAASYIEGSGLPIDAVGGAARRRLDGGEQRARGRPRAVGHRERGVAGDADQLGAAQHGLGGGAQLAVVEVLVATDDDDIGAARELRVVDDPQPGVGDVVDERLGADHERGAAAGALGEDELERRAGGDHLVERGLEAEAPELAHELLGGVTGVVGEEGDALAGLAQRVDGLRRAIGRLVADPQAAVEVEEDVVVAAGGGGERHAPVIIIAADVQAPCCTRTGAVLRAPAGRLRRRREARARRARVPPWRPRRRRPLPRPAARRSPRPSPARQRSSPSPSSSSTRARPGSPAW